jgi:SAM-dependent methyltransferase
MASFVQRLRSSRHGFWLGVSERLRWSRGPCRETPANELSGLAPQEAQRIAALQQRYQLRFELQLSAATARRNYEYLDILDIAWEGAGLPRPVGGALTDVGCANFWYAATLQAFFHPARLTGVEVEGHRLYRDGHARCDYAAGYLEGLPQARFLVADYTAVSEPADLVTAWFPFVTPAAILAWRLPLRLLDPSRLFARIAANLVPGGRLVMVNHGPQEAAVAQAYCIAAGLACEFAQPAAQAAGVLSGYRAEVPVVSVWRRLADAPAPDISLRY